MFWGLPRGHLAHPGALLLTCRLWPGLQQRHCTFFTPPRPIHHGCLRECWLLSGSALVLLSQAGKIGVPSPSPSRGCQKLQADICADFNTASTRSKTGFPACGGSSQSTLREHPSARDKEPTAWDTKRAPGLGALQGAEAWHTDSWLGQISLSLSWTPEPRTQPEDQDGS